MSDKDFIKMYSQLDLPFQETKEIYLKKIFKTLEKEFDLKENSKQSFIDLGSGNGRIIIYSAINYRIRSIGIEIDPILIKEAKNSIRLLREAKTFEKKLLNKITLIHGNFYTHSLKKYDFIYIYSLPTMQKYLKHVFKTAQNGSIIISHIYPLKNLNIYLELKLKLEFDKEDKETFTFFYRRI